MTLRVGINGFGRIGRLSFRVATDENELEVIKINDPGGDVHQMAHLLNFDSVHGRWHHQADVSGNDLVVDGRTIEYTGNKTIEDSDWSGCDVVIEASGFFKQKEQLQKYIEKGVKKVVVSAPLKQPGLLDIVMGVNDHLYNPEQHHIVSAASCTTNCLAPVVKVIHEALTIKHGSMTTIHDITNTQTIIDSPHKDLRRARSCGSSLIPTTTGSATAITHIFPELNGKLDGHAVRVPLTNASLTDCVFEVETATDVETVNRLLKKASENELKDILGYEERPLVSVDYKTDPRSSIIDALSTLVINGTQVKIYCWYDNEWGYSNRVIDLVKKVFGISS